MNKKKLLSVALLSLPIFVVAHWLPVFGQNGCEWLGCIGPALLYGFFGVAIIPLTAFVCATLIEKDSRWKSGFAALVVSESVILATLFCLYAYNNITISQSVHMAQVTEGEISTQIQAQHSNLPNVGSVASLRGVVVRNMQLDGIGAYLDVKVEGDKSGERRIQYLNISEKNACKNPLPAASAIPVGAYIEVRAMTTYPTAFSTCDSVEYYIKVSSASSTPK